MKAGAVITPPSTTRWMSRTMATISSRSGELRNVIRESFDVVGRSNDPTEKYQLDVAHEGYPYGTSWSLQSLATGAVVLPLLAFTKYPSSFICRRSCRLGF